MQSCCCPCCCPCCPLIFYIIKGQVYYRCHTKDCITKGLRETTIENYLTKAFEAIELYPEETEVLQEILNEHQHEWISKQKELLQTVRLQGKQIEERLSRLTDCYVEGGLDKNTFEQRKEKLLFETKQKELAELEISGNYEGILKKIQKFLELVKSLKNSFEIGISDEQRAMVQIVTSNLRVEGKKLLISMVPPFAEMAERWNLNSGEPRRDKPRKNVGDFVFSDINTSPVIGKPLSRKKLKTLFNRILKSIEQTYDIDKSKLIDIGK